MVCWVLAFDQYSNVCSTNILASNTSRQLFSITNSLLGKVKSSPLPSSIPLSELPQRFSDFFHSKVTSIRRNLDSTTVTPPSVPDQPFCGTVRGAFQSVSEDEVKKILTQSTIKTCELDPLPAFFLTHCLDDLLPHLTSTINDSLHSGLFPSAFKSEIVKPLLKKTNLHPEIYTVRLVGSVRCV